MMRVVTDGPGSRLHSPDERWFWTGTAWVPAWSPDQRWWWNGQARVRAGRLKPPWRKANTIQLVVGLFGVPAGLAILALTLAFAAHFPARTVAWVSLGLFRAALGGIIVRPEGRWRETLFLGVCLTTFLATIDMAAFVASGTTGNAQATDDNGVAVGMLMLFVGTPLPFAAFALIGRAARRGLSRVLSKSAAVP